MRNPTKPLKFTLHQTLLIISDNQQYIRYVDGNRAIIHIFTLYAKRTSFTTSSIEYSCLT